MLERFHKMAILGIVIVFVTMGCTYGPYVIPNIFTDPVDRAIHNLTIQIISSFNQQSPGREGITRVAVVDFCKADGKLTKFSQYVTEKFITSIFKTRKFEVIERRLLYKILKEQKLTLSDLFDPNSVREMGKLLGADAILTGTIFEQGSNLDVNARIISIQTGTILGAGEVKVAKAEAEKKRPSRRRDENDPRTHWLAGCPW